MQTQSLTAFLLFLLFAVVAAWVGVRLRKLGIRPLRRLLSLARSMSLLGWCVSIVLLGVFGMRGGEKFGGGLRSSNLPVEDGWENMPPITSTNTTRTLEADDFRRGFVLARVGTDEAFAFAAPSGAVVCADWRAFGAAEDWTYANVEWRIENGELWGGVLSNETTRLRIHSDGWVETGGSRSRATETAADALERVPPVFYPFRVSLGIVPQTNWPLVAGNENAAPEDLVPSQFWHFVTPSNTLQLTWQNVLLDRLTNTPVSVQVEFWPNGRFAYRYDLRNVECRIENGELDADELTNIVMGASIGSIPLQFTLADFVTNTSFSISNSFSILHSPFSIHFHPLSPEDATNHDRDGDGLSLLDELFAFGTDPDLADTDRDGCTDSEELAAGTDPLDAHSIRPDVCDGYALAMGGLDPLALPEGSTNTVLEHLFYTGTTNGTISLPQPSETHAVLSVSVSGYGTGRLAVGDRVVQLFLPEPTRSDPPASCAYACPVPRGQDVPVFLCADGTLSVAFDSSEFAFGTLPSIGGETFTGFINFPNTVATTPCIHDFNARDVSVSLPVGQGASQLSCSWTGTAGVGVANLPPRAATISGDFSPWQTRSISYELSHPLYLFGQTHYQQTARFCPQPSEPEDEEEVPPWYEEGEGYASDGSEDDDGEQPWHLCGCGECGDDCVCGCRPPDSWPEPGGEPGGEEEEEDVCPEHEVPYSQCAHLHKAAYTNAVQSLPPLNRVLYIRNPLDWQEIQLEVPSEPRRCCPCPDHWQNYVEVSYKSRDLRLVDGAGLPFRRAGESCTVRVAGAVPSSSPGDAWLAFSRNGEDYLSYRYTVLGVAIRSASGPPLSSYGTENPTFGFPVAVATNAWDSPQLKLVTNVGLGVGNVRVAFENATGDFALWRVSLLSGGYRKLLDTSGAVSRAMPMQGWRWLIYDAGLHGAAYLPVFVTSSSAGHVDLVLRYWTEVGGCFVEDEVRQRITSVNPPLMADIDRDGTIGDGDVAAYLGGKVFRFWTNEDFWKGDDAFAGEDRFALNSLDMVVNGRNDLINLLPVAIDVSPFVDAWGSSATFRIRGNGAIRYVLADMDWNGMGQMQIDDCLTTGNAAIRTAQLSSLSSAGYVLNPSEVELSESGSLTMLMEASQPCSDPVEIVVEVGGEEMFKFRPRIEFASVRNMYRWYNRRGVAGGEVTDVDRAGDPQGWPDEERDGGANGPMLVFVHGYNMAEWEARAWADGVFKRLWWSGLNAKFAAVAWYGNDGQMYMPTEGLITPNYHVNVEHAFATAPAFASLLNGLPGSKYILAHSLGNMLVSAAKQDYGLQHAKYFMLNAAVPVEAYDASGGVTAESKAGMTHPDWANYPDRVRASHWWELFPLGDGRHTLTWKNRFANVTDTVNYYSSEEEVLANGNGTVPNIPRKINAWNNQELWKGNKPITDVPLVSMGRNEGGWAFNPDHDVYEQPIGPPAPATLRRRTPDETTNLTDTILRECPFFEHFQNRNIYTSTNGVIVTENVAYRAQLLADAIPAESFAAGANPVPAWRTGMVDECNINMAIDCKDPDKTGEISPSRWTHSFFIGAPYMCVHGLYDDIVSRIPKERSNE